MALDGCGVVCKCLLYIFNLIFGILGIAMLGLGLWLRFSENTRPIFEMNAFDSTTFVIGVIVLIVLGVVMLFVVSVGEHAVCYEKKCALHAFAVLLFILAAAEITVGVLAYSSREEVGKKVAEFYNSIYTLFVARKDVGIGVTLVFIHQMLHCCGVTGIALLEIVKETCPAPQGVLETLLMPTCPGVITDFFNNNAPMVMATFIGIGMSLMIALVCTIVLLKQIKTGASRYSY
ncbi:CD9 antigen isoform X2 [Corythoichthys intestinalis]|uniref:CD9 antigen isoform X2 n=1 Tax=Corythoichthys intestinalis TaxID=161448 RepID=UPI0025A6299A|nr:CD9 antigen isoform X2 [Corythoichthys intestinalis]